MQGKVLGMDRAEPGAKDRSGRGAKGRAGLGARCGSSGGERATMAAAAPGLSVDGACAGEPRRARLFRGRGSGVRPGL